MTRQGNRKDQLREQLERRTEDLQRLFDHTSVRINFDRPGHNHNDLKNEVQVSAGNGFILWVSPRHWNKSEVEDKGRLTNWQ